MTLCRKLPPLLIVSNRFNCMPTTYYEADRVEPMLKAAGTLMQELTDALEQAQNENSAMAAELMQFKQAAAGRITLEKVASPVVSVSDDQVGRFVDALARHAVIDSTRQEEYKEACMKDPNNALEFAIHALELSEAPASQGKGYSTKAATNIGLPGDEAKEEYKVLQRMLR